MADMERVSELLNNIVSNSICGPGGDPDSVHLQAAANAIRIADQLGIEIQSREGWEMTLRGQNICEQDFLAEP